MSDATRRVREDIAADPWWGEPQPVFVEALDPAPQRVRRRTRRARTGIGWRILGLLATPFVALGRRARRSDRVRRLAVRVAIVLLVAVFLACSVGVILINNVVIGRTAELGKLDDRRRELRRENALLGAKAAQLSAPPVVFRRAEHDLGMLRTSELPQFIYLDPTSHTLTPLQRRRRAAVLARMRATAEQRDQLAATGGGTGTATPTTGAKPDAKMDARTGARPDATPAKPATDTPREGARQ
jgi:hypothetical protein